MTRTRRAQKAATPAKKAATPPAPAAAAKVPAAPKTAHTAAVKPAAREALAIERDGLLREAFSLTSEQLFDLATVTRKLEKIDADAAAAALAAQADTPPA